jgi:MFS family permease
MFSLTLPASRSVPKRIYRLAIGTLFFIAGLCFASWASRIPHIQAGLELSEAGLGVVLFSLPVGLMLSLPFSGWLVAKVGSPKIVPVAALLYSLILVCLGLAQTVPQLVACLFLFGFIGNLQNIAVNTQAVGVEALYKKPIMASFHGIWSLAGFAGAALGTLMIGAGVSPSWHFLFVLIPVTLAIAVSSRFILPDDGGKQENKPIFAKPDKSLVNLGIIAFCAMICEGTMFDWSGVYFKKVVQADAAWVGAGYTAFMGTMALTRFFADRFTDRYGLKRILQWSGVFTASGLLIAVLFPHLATAIIGFLLVGAGVSSVVPLVYSAAGKSKVLSPGVALAAVSTIGFLGFLLGPPVIGLVAGATSLRVSFALVLLMGLGITVVATRARSLY